MFLTKVFVHLEDVNATRAFSYCQKITFNSSSRLWICQKHYTSG